MQEIINVKTGEVTQRELTQEEIDALTPSPEEVQQWIVDETKRRQQEALLKFQEKQVLDTVQQLSDEEALSNKDVYPLWEVGIAVKKDSKYQDFNAENEMVLWKAIQPHTTQSDWRPKDTPSLWLRVGYDGEILDFKPPTGAHDAYQMGDKMRFEGKIYRSKINNNTWSPRDYPQGWELVE